MADPSDTRTIFFAAFEPSGDLLAARLIQELKRREPTMRFVGFGGPKMAEQGAELIEQTTEHAVAMGTGAIGQVKTHLRRLGVLDAYLKQNDIAALVPVDSPAANWSVCRHVRKHRPGAKIVHLVCPQIWSWARWRIRRLRRLSDLVLCLLPFEPAWLDERGVPGVFVGHPVFEDAPAVLDAPAATDLPKPTSDDGLRLALMPGSRKSELLSNWPTMLAVLRSLKAQHPSLVAVVAARRASDADVLKSIDNGAGLPQGVHVVPGRTPEVLRWADVALVKSGTSTLQVASLRRPMVAFYNLHPLKWHAAGRWLVASRTFTLPNIISEWQDGRRVVPEFVPHFGDPAPILAELLKLVSDPEARQHQRAGLSRVAEPFLAVQFKDAAADALLKTLQ